MAYAQLQILSTAEHADAIGDALIDAGALAITLQDAADEPLFEPPPGATPLWGQTCIIGLFEQATNPLKVLLTLHQSLDPNLLEHCQWQALADENWVKAWEKYFKPMLFGERLWICPSGQSVEAPEGIIITLDPGLAFGTGTHPTTRLCLEWLDGHPPQDQRVIDYGCGSGILAIGAAKLGAREIIAIDNDPQALLATEGNFAKNALQLSRQIGLPEEVAPAPVNLLMANILANPLVELAHKLTDLVVPRGQIVLSGILEEQAKDVIAAYEKAFDITNIQQLEQWILIHGIKI